MPLVISIYFEICCKYLYISFFHVSEWSYLLKNVERNEELHHISPSKSPKKSVIPFKWIDKKKALENKSGDHVILWKQFLTEEKFYLIFLFKKIGGVFRFMPTSTMSNLFYLLKFKTVLRSFFPITFRCRIIPENSVFFSNQ